MNAATAQQPTMVDVTDDLAARRQLAFEANFELESLAAAAKTLLDEDRNEDSIKYIGILSRIVTLSNIVFFAMRLHGDPDPDQAWGDRDKLATLQRVFDGGLA